VKIKSASVKKLTLTVGGQSKVKALLEGAKRLIPRIANRQCEVRSDQIRKAHNCRKEIRAHQVPFTIAVPAYYDFGNSRKPAPSKPGCGERVPTEEDIERIEAVKLRE
jgi:hypothetical protein